MRFETVGVVGAGVMGTGLAQDLAQHDHRVILVDLGDGPLDHARATIRQSVRMQGFFSKKKGPSADEVLAKIEFTDDYERLAEARFVVENVVEKWPVKEEVHRRIDGVVPDDCVVGVNTSCISITQVGSVTRRPDKIAGMHFMNPVPLKPMVEVIRGFHTSDETLDTVREFLAGFGKDCIVVNDMPGFVSNRVLMLTINEAIFLVQDGVASAEDIDRLFTTCFGHKMGPLQTGDLIGLDTILDSLMVLWESYNDSKFRPSPLLKKMVHAGHLGRKSGRGFFDYGSGGG